MLDRRRYLALWLRTLARYERALRIEVARERNRLIEKAAADYAGGTDLPSYLFTQHQKAVSGILAVHYRQTIPTFAAMTLKQVKSRKAYERKQVQDAFAAHAYEWVAREALRKSKLIADTDRADVMGAIAKGLEEGLGTEEIARNIRKVSQLTKPRASTVARTETHAAATYAASESARQAEQDFGIVLVKEWLPTMDDCTREDHRAMVSHPPIPLNEKFSVGGELMDRPGDPSASAANLVNCRCALLTYEAEQAV